MDNTTAQRRHLAPLGAPLRLCQLYFLFEVVLAFGFAVVCNREDFAYDLGMLRTLVLVSAGTRSVWLIEERADTARTFSVTTVILCVVLSVLDFVFGDAYVQVASVVGDAGALAMIVAKNASALVVALYLGLSKNAAAVLTKPLNTEPTLAVGHSYDKPLRVRLKTWPFWRDLGICYASFCLLGHWAEMLFCRLIVAGVFMGDYDPSNTMLWDQWLYPFPAEGMAAAAIIVVLTPFKEWLKRKFNGHLLMPIILSCLVTCAICVGIDFFTGITCNQDYSLWDYRALPFNFMGQVCLQNSSVYCTAACLILWVFYPLIDRMLCRMPRHLANGLFFGFGGIYVYLALLNLVEF